jgi:hypothetical protein
MKVQDSIFQLSASAVTNCGAESLLKANNFSANQEFPRLFWELKVSLPCSQEPTIGPYPELVESNPYQHTKFQIHFNIIISSTPSSCRWSFPFSLSNKNSAYSSHVICAWYRILSLQIDDEWAVCLWRQSNQSV